MTTDNNSQYLGVSSNRQNQAPPTNGGNYGISTNIAKPLPGKTT
jgi:hypothetical protein